MEQVNKPVDKSEWFMPPHMVNAYYNPSFNEIVFPAAILQPPFFDPKADDALNYGGIGAVIGHEITHGFDDQGSQFDGDGNLKSWWTIEDQEKFNTKANKLVEQYNAYTVLDSMHVNGQLTLGENIADLGGISIALDGLQLALKKNNPGKIQNFDPEQRLFLAWARVWCGLYRDDALASRIKTDFHAPMMFRAIGPLENLDNFASAFSITPQNKHYKKEKIRIW
jgi:putative endopeptidase